MQRTILDPDMGEIIFRKQPSNKQYIIRLRKGEIIVSLPIYGTYQKAMDFYWENREKLLKKYKKWKEKELPPIDENEMRKVAKATLPVKLAELATQHGFSYQTSRISRSKTRWGSCTSKGVICLSLYLTILPEHLVEYVLLHELCHTVHMNHSPAFWSLLDEHTDGQAKKLRRELKDHCFQ